MKIKLSLAFLLVLSFLGLTYMVVSADAGTPFPTSTPQPTNTSPTPGPGSGCPQDLPDEYSASYYRNCRVCFQENDPLLNGTPTPTLTSTPQNTPTSTPSVTWYGKSRIETGHQVYTKNGVTSGWVVKQFNSTTLCGAPNRIVAIKSDLWRNYNVTYRSNCTNDNYWSTYGMTGWQVWGAKTNNTTVNNAFSSLWNSWGVNFLMNYQLNSNGCDNYYLGINTGGDNGQEAYFDNVQLICKNFNYASTPTPMPTSIPEKICVSPKYFEINSNMENFNNGLVSVGDNLKSTYHVFPYDKFANFQDWERLQNIKYFSIKYRASEVDTITFTPIEDGSEPFVGDHLIRYYDCSNNIVAEGNTGPGFNHYLGSSFPKTSICEITVETVDDGLEKYFGSDGIVSNGCDQVDCLPDDYFYDKAPFGISLEDFINPPPEVCNVVTEGYNFSWLTGFINTIVGVINPNWEGLPDNVMIPGFKFCVTYFQLPTIVIYDTEIPIGSIILLILLFSWWRGLGK